MLYVWKEILMNVKRLWERLYSKLKRTLVIGKLDEVCAHSRLCAFAEAVKM